MIGLVLLVAGLLLWLLGGYFLAGLLLMIAGLVLMLAPGPFYGYPYWRGRRGPP